MIQLAALLLAICPPGPRDNCVVDGDTFWLSGEKVRVENIDTPEIEGKCARERGLAIRARDRLLELLNSGDVVMRRSGTDRYGRTLARIRVNGRDVGETLVAEGLARRWEGRRREWCG